MSDAVEGEGCRALYVGCLELLDPLRQSPHAPLSLRKQTTHHTINQPPRSVHLGESREYHVILLSKPVMMNRQSLSLERFIKDWPTTEFIGAKHFER